MTLDWQVFTFSVYEITEDFLRRNEQIEHLPHGELEVHVAEAQQPLEELAALGTSRVSAHGKHSKQIRINKIPYMCA